MWPRRFWAWGKWELEAPCHSGKAAATVKSAAWRTVANKRAAAAEQNHPRDRDGRRAW